MKICMENNQYKQWEERLAVIIDEARKNLLNVCDEDGFVPEAVISMALNYEIASTKQIAYVMGRRFDTIPPDLRRTAFEALCMEFSKAAKDAERRRLSDAALREISTALAAQGWTAVDVMRRINCIVAMPPGPKEVHDLRCYLAACPQGPARQS